MYCVTEDNQGNKTGFSGIIEAYQDTAKRKQAEPNKKSPSNRQISRTISG
jgi:hypothetical protein